MSDEDYLMPTEVRPGMHVEIVQRPWRGVIVEPLSGGVRETFIAVKDGEAPTAFAGRTSWSVDAIGSIRLLSDPLPTEPGERFWGKTPLADFPDDAPAAPPVSRVTAVQEARLRIARLVDAVRDAAEAAGKAAAAVEYADADLTWGRPNGSTERLRTASLDALTAHEASTAAQRELTAAIAEALTFGPLAEQDALPARPVTPPRLAWEDRTVSDDLAAEAADARTEALR